MRRPWSSEVFCSDASPDGYGICTRSLSEHEISNIGLWQERWRYKQSTAEDWCPRERFFRYDPPRIFDLPELTPMFWSKQTFTFETKSSRKFFKEILSPDDWKEMDSSWGAHCHITLKEGRAFTLLARRVARDQSLHHKKIFILVDNLALAFSVGKGRSCNHSMLRVAQKLGALALACNLCLRVLDTL